MDRAEWPQYLLLNQIAVGHFHKNYSAVLLEHLNCEISIWCIHVLWVMAFAWSFNCMDNAEWPHYFFYWKIAVSSFHNLNYSAVLLQHLNNYCEILIWCMLCDGLCPIFKLYGPCWVTTTYYWTSFGHYWPWSVELRSTVKWNFPKIA